MDDSSYFKNLEAALRETLISAQRIADETVTEAKKKAEQAIDDAQKHATSLRASAKAETDELLAKAKAEAESLRTGAAKDAETAKAEFENLRAKNEAYRAKFKSILEEQLKLFTGGDDEE